MVSVAYKICQQVCSNTERQADNYLTKSFFNAEGNLCKKAVAIRGSFTNTSKRAAHVTIMMSLFCYIVIYIHFTFTLISVFLGKLN